MKSISIIERVYERLKTHAKIEGEDIEILASTYLRAGIKQKEALRMQLEVNSTPHREVIEKWLM